MNEMNSIVSIGFRIPAFLFLGMVLLGAVGSQSGGRTALVGDPGLGQGVILSGQISTVTGEVIEADSLSGRVILVNAWATWCGPCVREMPAFQRVLDEYQDRGFLVIGISADEGGPEVVRSFIENLGISYPVTVGSQPPLSLLAAQVRGLPTSFLLGRDGRVIRRVEGVFSEEDLREALEKLLDQRPHSRELVHPKPGEASARLETAWVGLFPWP